MSSEQTHFDLIVIGSGAAGSACWFAARQQGKSVAVFEDDALGGECANFACIPTKALLHAAEVYESAQTAALYGVTTKRLGFDYARVKAWKDSVLKETGAALGTKPYEDAGVTLVQHRAVFTAPGEIEAGGRRFTADRFLVATGAREVVPEIEGLQDAGFLTFREAIDLTSLPESVFIMGGGAVGCEFTQLFNAFGSRVVLLETNSRLLHNEDAEAGEQLGRIFQQRGVQLITDANVLSARRDGRQRIVTVERGGRQEVHRVDQVLIAIGKAPNIDIGLEAAGVTFDPKTGIDVDARMRSSNPVVYAAGDVAGPYRFTHAASYQGQLAAANMFGEGAREADYRAIVRCVFTTPEVCAVGMTEEQARDEHVSLQIGRSDLHDNDRGLTSGRREGLVKVVADADGTLLGGVMVGPRAGEVMHELALAVQLRAKASDIAGLVHAFPTFSEALGAACGALQPA
jgi:pyruvate/2-oxoglutarate dehydrogenase complex dihydrolipoamide dehydrogenase (E3) component